MPRPEEELIGILKKNGVDITASLPCEKFKTLLAMLPGAFAHVPLTREEEGIGICAGASLAGRRPAMFVQSSGIGNMINALLSLTQFYGLPLALFVSRRGVYQEKIAAQLPMGKRLPAILRGAGISFTIVNTAKDLALVRKDLPAVYRKGLVHAFLLSPKVWERSECSSTSSRFKVQSSTCEEAKLTTTGLRISLPSLTRFEIIKLRVEQSIAIYNALVQAFNIRVQAYATEANIYKIRIDAEMAKIEIFKAEIEAQKLIGQVNQQQIELYRAQLEGLKTDVDLYRARIDAVRAVVEIGTQKVQTYRAQIDAYVALVQSERTKYDIFRAQVDAEIAKTNIISAEADVFKTKMSTIDAAASIAVKKVDGQLRLAQQQTAQFVAEAEAEKARITTAADMFRAQASAYENSLGVLRVEDERAVKAEEFNLTQFKTDWDNTLKQYEISIKKYDADMQRMIELAKLQQSNAQVIAQYASQIAAGAMSAVQMSISATGGATSSESWNVNQDI